MAYLDFITGLHTGSKRDYLERVTAHDKAACAEIAKRFDREYWDGDRSTGYGGMRYDGRWIPVAEAMARHYRLRPGDRVLDVGCGKGYLLHDLTLAVPGLEVVGLDLSDYAIAHAKEEIRPHLVKGDAVALPFPDHSFDLVLSLNTLHNLAIHQLVPALAELARVGRRDQYVVVESFRNEREKVNLLYWQLTCLSIHPPEAWEWIFRQAGYGGDHGFVFFE
jgi:protein-L-isoaspartate(D-aspartate) O-methyltransferase